MVVIPGEFPEDCLQGHALLILCHFSHITWTFQNCPVIWSASLVVTQEWLICRSNSSAHPVHQAFREASHSWNEGFLLPVTLSFHSLKQRQCCRSWAAQWEASNSGFKARISCSHSLAARKPWVTWCFWINLALRWQLQAVHPDCRTRSLQLPSASCSLQLPHGWLVFLGNALRPSTVQRWILLLPSRNSLGTGLTMIRLLTGPLNVFSASTLKYCFPAHPGQMQHKALCPFVNGGQHIWAGTSKARSISLVSRRLWLPGAAGVEAAVPAALSAQLCSHLHQNDVAYLSPQRGKPSHVQAWHLLGRLPLLGSKHCAAQLCLRVLCSMSLRLCSSAGHSGSQCNKGQETSASHIWASAAEPKAGWLHGDMSRDPGQQAVPGVLLLCP